MKTKRQSDLDKFHSSYTINTTSNCWEWNEMHGNRYPPFWSTEISKGVGGHRYSYEIHKGDPTGFFVCHECDNPRCVNPAHLFLGTHQDNVDDMVSKGRQASGSKNGMFGRKQTPEGLKKISETRKAAVGEIRGEYKKFTCPHCKFVGGGGNMKRYHFDNCKSK
jgi:hypothetical protein